MTIDTLKDANEVITKLHESDKWIKAPWRKKIKLANKTFQRLENKYGLCFKRYYDGKLTSTEQKSLLFVRKEIIKSVVSPLRLNYNGLTFPNPLVVLTFCDISNRLGGSLTRLAKKRNSCIHVCDLFHMKRLKIPYEKVPFRPYHEYNEEIQYYQFWRGYQYYSNNSNRNKYHE